jgi:RHS repeat-associated protein
VTALVNSAGALQASYRYDPYGRYLAGGGTLASANMMRFSSKPWVGFAGSATSGLYYYGYRFYDPYLQRWVNRDPIGERGGHNLYGFLGNRPNTAIDAHGWAALPWIIGGGIGAVAGAFIFDRVCSDEQCLNSVLAEFRTAEVEAESAAPDNSRHEDEGSIADALTHCIGACTFTRHPPVSCVWAARRWGLLTSAKG